jgi:hypothetical protein
LKCAGRAKRRRRFRFGGPPSDSAWFASESAQKAELQTIQSGVALRLPPHSKNYFANAATGPSGLMMSFNAE